LQQTRKILSKNVKLNGRDCFDIAEEENLFFVKKLQGETENIELFNGKTGSLKGTVVSDSRNVC